MLMDPFKQVENDILLFVSVKTLQRENKLYLEDNKVILQIKEPPTKGKANKEIIKFLKNQFKRKIKIESGLTSKNKVIRVINIDLNQMREFLENNSK